MHDMIYLYWGGVYGLLGVLLGAFGAHGLRNRLSADMLAIWNTGVQYQFYHALALLGVGILAQHWPANGFLSWAGWLFGCGVLVFSGSLYVLALTGVRRLGAITPFGGLALLAGWVLLLAALGAS